MHSGRMTQPTLFPREQQLVVLSASRRTDLVACYPEFLIEKLRDYPPEQVHSLVVWTKNPQNMIAPGALRETLERYRQLYVHLTITGLGGTVLEPHIPSWETVLQMVPALIALVKVPERISWRFDPCALHGPWQPYKQYRDVCCSCPQHGRSRSQHLPHELG